MFCPLLFNVSRRWIALRFASIGTSSFSYDGGVLQSVLSDEVLTELVMLFVKSKFAF